MKSFFAIVAVAAVSASAAPAFAFDWNGFYAGVGVGYSAGHADGAYINPLIPNGIDTDSDPAGWLAGAQVGYNAAMSGVVLGVEASLYAADITDTTPDDLAALDGRPGETIMTNVDFTGSLRGRVGFDAGDFMPYLTAGVAFASVTVDATDGPITESATLWGWTAGAGLEGAVAENVTVGGQYLYTSFGDHTWSEGETWESSSSSASHTVSVGVNFHF
jgi:outer membrane immunogenic protein